MLFPTIEFAIFFPIVLGALLAADAAPGSWKPFIVLASYVFYAAADPRFCLLLGGITVGNQIAVRLIAAQRRRAAAGADLRRRGDARPAHASGSSSTTASSSTTSATCSTRSRLGLPLPLLTIALPIGISFFTFQAITYVVDVKRGDAEPASLVDAAIYLSFFPHLVAGPIVRASEFLPQLKTPRDPEPRRRRRRAGADRARADQEGR